MLLRPLLAAAIVAFAASIADAATTISFLSGKVSRQRAGVWDDVSIGAVLQGGDVVSTAKGGRATLTFDDGTRVDLGPGSSMSVRETSAENSRLELTLGKLKAWVSKVKTRKFDVKTPTAVCSVRGTEFEIRVDNGGRTNVQMYEGLLAVSDGRGNETLLKDNQSIQVTERGLGQVSGDSRQSEAGDRAREAARREVGLEMSKEQVQAAAAIEAKNAVYQEGKAIVDVNGRRVRIEEYIVRPSANQFKLVVLNERSDRFDYFYYKGTFNTTLPDDLSVALRQLGGCVGAPCDYFMTGYDTGRSNTIDNMLEVTSGGHQVDVNNNASATDNVTAFYDPRSDTFQAIAAGTPYFRTLFDNYRLTFNGVMHGQYNGANIQQISDAVDTSVTTLQQAPGCAPPNCTYTEDGVLHQVVYMADGTGTIWEKYDSYIISDEGRIATTADFAGTTTGADYKQRLLGYNFQTIVTASEFQGRKIDLAVEPRIFIQSGLIP